MRAARSSACAWGPACVSGAAGGGGGELSLSTLSRRSVSDEKMRSQQLAFGSTCRKRQGRAREHTNAAGAVRAHHPESSNDFGRPTPRSHIRRIYLVSI